MNFKRYHRYRSERGQSMILVAMLMVSMIGMLALVIDGGNTYFQRRLSQNAADAGALAGARELCVTSSADLAVDKALEYAIDHNGAVEAEASSADGEVTVVTRIPFPTWFGGIFGQSEITAGAIAAAGCFAPEEAASVLPIAYSCIDGVLTGEDGQRYCDPLEYGPEYKYIIMNSDKTDEDLHCFSEEEPWGVDCDMNNDGIDELLVGGNRSWLDLSGGGGGASELCDWIQNGYPNYVKIHTWYAGQSGVAGSIFDCFDTMMGKKMLLPVYDMLSHGDPPLAHTEDQVQWGGGASTSYFHVISFAMFVPTCYHKGGKDSCEVYDQFRDAGVLKSSDKTLEGYFIKGFANSARGRPVDGVDSGVYALFLTR